jgi:hypothetical protein
LRLPFVATWRHHRRGFALGLGSGDVVRVGNFPATAGWTGEALQVGVGLLAEVEHPLPVVGGHPLPQVVRHTLLMVRLSVALPPGAVN